MNQLSALPASDKEAWSLDQWLTYLEKIHPQNIELGLERVKTVYQSLKLDFSQSTVITVAGTNGKGTTCAFLEQALLCKEKSVAVFSSPHIIDYRERVRVAGAMLSEQAHCQAFLTVEAARGETSLTYFEFGTLAALQLMADSAVDYLLLEVGLGGRLDAVNIVEPNIAVITSIDLDHQDWLGNSKELIAIEKAGIFRPNIPAVIGEPEPPHTLLEAAETYQVKPSWQGRNFHYKLTQDGFFWHNSRRQYNALPIPNIPAQNASTALQVIDILQLNLNELQLAEVFKNTRLPGRRQVIQQQPKVILDVAHNPQSTSLLAQDIAGMHYKRVIAVVAMLADKDINASLLPMQSVVTDWFCASVDSPRAATTLELVSVLSNAQTVLNFNTVEDAYKQALTQAHKDDLIIVFGSFLTVADVLKIEVSKPQEKVK